MTPTLAAIALAILVPAVVASFILAMRESQRAPVDNSGDEQ